MAGVVRAGLRLSHGVKTTISPPPISQAAAWATKYKPTATQPLLNVSQGAPSAPPPPELLEALGAAASDGASSGYLTPRGSPELASALANEMHATYGRVGLEADIKPDDLAITAGCNLAYAAAVQALCDPGDEVILPVPWYFNHQMTNNMFGIKTVPLPVMSADGYQPSPERAAPLITERTRAIALTSPNNPTGAVYSPSLLASFASLAREHNIALILDETYRDFILPGPPHDLFSFPAATPTHAAPPDWHWRSTVVHLYSFSKAYHIPGHRLGAIAAGPELLDAIITVLDCLQICASAPAQHALARPGLLPSLRTFVRTGAAALASRQAVFVGACPSAWKIGAQGAYYAFVRHPFAGRTAQEVCERLTYELGVVALPVEFFAAGADVEGLEPGWESWIRISVANVDEEKIREVCGRMKQATDEWEWNLASDVGN